MSFKCVGCGAYKANIRLDGPQYCKECESKRTTCDTPGCGREIPKGGEGHPEICPTCLVQIAHDAKVKTLAQLLEDEARGFAKGTAMVRAYVQSLCDQLEVLRLENERLRPTKARGNNSVRAMRANSLKRCSRILTRRTFSSSRFAARSSLNVQINRRRPTHDDDLVTAAEADELDSRAAGTRTEAACERCRGTGYVVTPEGRSWCTCENGKRVSSVGAR